MKAIKELIHHLDAAKVNKQWELSLAAMEARNGIPDILGDSPDRLCQLAEIYVMAAIQGPCYDWYMYLADCALHMAQQVSGSHEHEVIILRSHAFKAHMEYIVYGPVGKKGYACHRPDKLSLVNRAVNYYEMLMQENYMQGYLKCLEVRARYSNVDLGDKVNEGKQKAGQGMA